MPNSLVIHDQETTRKLVFNAPINLMDLLVKAGLTVPHPCAGNGSCGKCRVKLRGALAPVTANEKAVLVNCESETRLSCQVTLLGDAELWLNAHSKDDMHVVTAVTSSLHAYDGGLERPYGIAVDIGTTTVAAYLYRMDTGALCHSCGEINNQTSFGADVISRIVYAEKNGGKLLHRALITQCGDLFQHLSACTGISLSNVSRIVITGNTTMLHFLTDKNTQGIGRYPFEPESLFGYTIQAATLFGELLPNASLYLPPCISAYVGADIVCGILACDMENAENALLLDIGTNGEMALACDGRLLCCSTAAGPAFEGRDIANGMPAKPGAINHVFAAHGNISYTTIEDARPLGICGTGIISAVSTMLLNGFIDESGFLEPQDAAFSHCFSEIDDQTVCYLGNSGIYLTQKDIRNIQLAKAAISAGVETMLHAANKRIEDITKLYLCGGFGNYIVPEEAANIGLFSKALLPVITPCGNSAATGAASLLFSEKLRDRAMQLSTSAVDLELSANPFFMEKYTENMMFEC